MSKIFSEAREAQIFAAQAIQPKDLIPSKKTPTDSQKFEAPESD